MKTTVRNLFLTFVLLGHSISAAFAQSSAVHNPAPAPHATTIPFDQIGAVAGKQYSGDGLALAATPDGAQLHCAFQRLDGRVTTKGLWLVSTKDGATGQPFRVIASGLGHDEAKRLSVAGKVEVSGHVARLIRPGLTEEYSAGIDGVRQDFVIERRPEGKGPLRLELEVDGAKAEAMPGGARLVLQDCGRNMAYNRVTVLDASGKKLSARLEVESSSHLIVVVDDAAAQYPVRIDPTFSDANWSSLGGFPGVAGTVYASTMDNAGNLYVGGLFNVAGNAIATNIAEWNGSSWSSLGSGVNGTVKALAIAGTNLLAGGTFTNAGGISANYVAQWNGRSWSPLGSGMNNAVFTLAVSGTNVFAGGAFTSTGPVAGQSNPILDYIAEWNGNNWYGLGGGLSTNVYALAISGTNLFVGGSFTAAGGVTASYVAEWNGSFWSPLGSGVDGTVYALAVSGTNLFAGGSFITAGGVSIATNKWGATTPLIAEWNGSSWSGLSSVGSAVRSQVIPLPEDVVILALAVSGTNLYAGGYVDNGEGSPGIVGQWNGSSGSVLAAFDPDSSSIYYQVNTLAAMGSNLFAGGQFRMGGAVSAENFAEWNGTSWSALGSGIVGDVYALALLGTNVFAGGFFTTANGAPANCIAQWNGSSWTSVGSGMSYEVSALLSSGTNLYAGDNGGSIDKWDGSSWLALGSAMNSYVSALAVLGTNLYAAGGFGVSEWNGSSWSTLGMNGVTALAVLGTNLYAGGLFSVAGGGVAANNIAEWNGSSWSALGSGLNNNENIFALAVSGTNLFAGSDFTSAGGVAANCVAEWNGSSWLALGAGLNGEVAALATSGDDLFAAGSFTSAGGAPANNIAVWNGNSWSALGSGVNGPAWALAVSGNNLLAAGSFTTAGTSGSGSVAEANIAPPTITGQPINTTVTIGNTGDFGVSASGSQGFDYQWYFNTNTLLPSGTSSDLAVRPASISDEGYYQVVVNNLFGSATSDVASLEVLVEPNMWGISNNPSGGTTTLSLASYPGSTNYVYATTNLTLPLSQWQLVATSVAASDGLFQFIDPNTKGVPAKFYRLSDQLITSPISISGVSPIAPQQYQTITISGSGFGSQSPYTGDSDYLYVLDVTGNWEAGYLPPGNLVTLEVTSWTDNQIVISGFTGDYYDYNTTENWTLQPGDNLTIAVWNPQTGVGPATFSVTVGSP